jgi:hypothetical protein
MRALEEYRMLFDGFSGRSSSCHLLLAPAEGVVLGELDDNPGTSLTNALELACAAVSDEFFDRTTDFPIFEWIPHDLPTDRPNMLEIFWHAQGFRLPEWKTPTRAPWFVSEAEKRIHATRPYTQSGLSERQVACVDLTGRAEVLTELHQNLPPAPRLPDSPPRRRGDR